LISNYIYMSRLLLISSFLIASFVYSQNPTVYAEDITAKELKSMLTIYASDTFQGREAGTDGEQMAVEYLRNEYQKLGVSAAKQDGDYFQYVPLKLNTPPKVNISIESQNFSYYQDFISVSSGPTKNMHFESYIYIGYGIKDTKHNDYKNIDVSGKLVVAIAGEPKSAEGNYVISGSNKISKWSNDRQSLRAKQNLAKEMGAAAFILIDESLFTRYARYYKRKDQSKGETNLSLDVNSNPFYGFLVGDNIGNSLIQKKNGLYYNDIQIDYKNTYESLVSENVVALIPGSEKPNEYIVISAHLDHIGIHHGAVFNGADDDGSGTVAILEIAEAFQKAVQNGDGPKRSILLLHVSAEEKGLLGSQYYTDFDPIVPLKNTVANLNIDMIGRTDPKRKNGKRNYIYLIGSDKLSTELHEISEMVNEKYTGIELDYTFNDENDPNRFYYRSDHYNFANKNIPIIFYFNGTHEDYHKATDTVDKIEFDLLENRTKLVFYTAWELANRKERVVVDKKFK